jgi:hypothetical protein
MRQFTLATSVATLLGFFLLGASASPSFARGGKKEAETSSSFNQQFDWENKVVGPKEGLDAKKVAATREQGVREDEERKKQVPQKKVKVVNDPATATLPTMDIEKPAAPTEKKQKKVAVAPPPRQRDALDNLLDEQGIKPNNPSAGGTGGDGLGRVLASDDKPARSKKAVKKTRGRRRN